jgi:hypothetical protein
VDDSTVLKTSRSDWSELKGGTLAADEKQTLSPIEWKSVSDYVMELSERMEKATSSTTGTLAETNNRPTEHTKD